MSKTMEINNTEVNQAVDMAVEAISATPKTSWKKFGIATAVVSTVCAVGYGIYCLATSKKDKEEQEPNTDVDNVEVAKRDFLDEESEENEE